MPGSARCATCSDIDESRSFWNNTAKTCMAACEGLVVRKTCFSCSEATLDKPYFDSASKSCVSCREAFNGEKNFWDPKT